MAKKKQEEDIEIQSIERGAIDLCIMGSSPLIFNRMSEKVRRELLFPSGRKNAAERTASLKHDPLEEFRSSPYTSKTGPTLLQVLGVWFKKAAAAVAIDLPDKGGSSKAQLNRLLRVPEERVALYGIPVLHMGVARMKDASRTPDIRTRACVQEWACKFRLTYVKPILRPDNVVKLVAAAGFAYGVGDLRPSQGSGDFGCFELVEPTNKEFKRIIKTGGRKAQTAAMAHPEFYDDETAALYAWYVEERKKRGFDLGGNGGKVKPEMADEARA